MYSGFVQKGNQQGRTIGIPTINLDPDIIPKTTKEGIYRASVHVEDKQYVGALYYGPRFFLGEKKLILEIHILDFTDTIYDEEISFSLHEFIRPPKEYSQVDDMIRDISHDIEVIRELAKKG